MWTSSSAVHNALHYERPATYGHPIKLHSTLHIVHCRISIGLLIAAAFIWCCCYIHHYGIISLPTDCILLCSLIDSYAVALSVVLTRLDFGCTTLAGLPALQPNRLQLVLNAAAGLVYSARRSEHVFPLCELHWQCVPEWIDFRLAILVHDCFNGTAPCYLASELQRVADTASRRRLHLASSPALHVLR